MDPSPGPDETGDGTVSANLTLKVGDYQIQARLTVPGAPIKPQATLPALQALVNAVVSTAERELEGTGKSVSCKAGCGACCRQAVPVSAVEAYHLNDLVEAMPEPRRGLIKARFAEAGRRLKQAGLYETLLNPPTQTTAQRQALGLDYFKLGIACPFLEEESCSIHLDRPLSCREYLVTSPAANCATPDKGGIEPVRVPMLSRTVLRIGANDDQPTSWRPLTLVPDWVAANPDTLPLRSGPEWVEYILNRVGKMASADLPEDLPPTAGSTPERAPDPGATSIALPMPAGAVSAIDMLPAFRAYTEAMIDRAVKELVTEGKQISCRMGCASCCRQFVVISTPEARRIAAVVDAMPEPRRSEVRRRFADVDQRIAAWSTTVGKHAGPTNDGARARHLARSYFSQNIACPMLENEACSIYEDRPLVCREYLVTSPAENCQRLTDPDVQIDLLPRQLASFALGHVLSDDTPPEPSRIALAHALRWVERNPVDDSPRLTAEAWLQRFFRRLEQVDELVETLATPTLPAALDTAPPPTLQIDVPAEPVRLRDMLEALRAVTDASVSHAITRVEAQGKRVSCKAGCGACCDQLVPLGIGEAHMIADLVARLPEPRRGVVRARFAAAEAALAAWSRRHDLDNLDALRGVDKYQLAIDYFRLGIACPFLEHGSCSIYADRPLVCREFLVTSPAINCARHGDPTAEIEFVPGSNANHALALLPYDNSADLQRQPLTLASSWAAAQPEDTETRPGRVWMERFFTRLRAVGSS
ncbi:MAG TPA: YkgJ family cysteine cluster protein [Vineibacter sp.]|nr:YkgJ family cysteine cluster protein [Vineibacter sp.]